jgi:(p)ppGpp synthase/HD superfamily hydrolase
MRGYSDRYEAALTLAARAHQQQKRKGTDVPYVVHPIHVSTILLRHGFPEEVILTGLLHDVVEDQDVPLVTIEADFGQSIAEMVAALTERKREGTQERPWETRKRELLAQVRQAGDAVIAVKAADSLHNARALAADLRRTGAGIWTYFRVGPGPSLQFYRQVAELVRSRLGAHPLAEELEDAVQDLERAILEAEVC